MWIGACTSSIGTWMQIAGPGLARSASSANSRLPAGLDPFLGGIPIFLFSLVGGVLADRFERRHMLIFSQCVQMCAALPAHRAGRLPRGPGLALLCLLLRFRVRAGLRRTGLLGADSHAGAAKRTCPTPSPCNPSSSTPRAMIGPALGGMALTQLGNTWCFGLNAPLLSGPDHFPAHAEDPLSAGEDRRKHPRRHEAGHRLHSQTGRHGGAHRAGVSA